MPLGNNAAIQRGGDFCLFNAEVKGGSTMRAKKVLLFIFAAVLGLSLLSYARREIPVDGRLVLLDVLPMFGRKSIPVPTGEKRTAGETENADLPIERPARRRIAMNLQGKEIGRAHV